jgi:hypothetical protein
MSTVFWNKRSADGGIHATRTTMSEVYFEILKKLRKVIQNKRRGMLTAPP